MDERYALVVSPADTVDQGLSMEDHGRVDVTKVKKQHQIYCRSLMHLGYNTIVLTADPRYPDSVFPEDPAIIIRHILVIARMYDPTRQGEEIRIKNALAPYFLQDRTFSIVSPGFIEGGDVLITDKCLYIGLSERTNDEGASQLASIAKKFCGYETKKISIPKNWLHLKGGVAYHPYLAIGKRPIITVSEEIADHFSDSGYELIITPAQERFSANCISGNDDEIFIHTGSKKTRRLLEKRGFKVYALAWELIKIDGALTCSSKLFGKDKGRW